MQHGINEEADPLAYGCLSLYWYNGGKDASAEDIMLVWDIRKPHYGNIGATYKLAACNYWTVLSLCYDKQDPSLHQAFSSKRYVCCRTTVQTTTTAVCPALSLASEGFVSTCTAS